MKNKTRRKNNVRGRFICTWVSLAWELEFNIKRAPKVNYLNFFWVLKYNKSNLICVYTRSFYCETMFNSLNFLINVGTSMLEFFFFWCCCCCPEALKDGGSCFLDLSIMKRKLIHHFMPFFFQANLASCTFFYSFFFLKNDMQAHFLDQFYRPNDM